MRTYNMDLTAGGVVRLAVDAEFIRCESATGEFTLRIDGAVRLEGFGAGLAYNAPIGERVRQIEIENTSGATNAIRVYAGSGLVSDNRLNLTAGTAISLTPGAEVDVIAPGSWAQFLKSPPAGACVLAAAANPLRREIIVSNSGAETQWIRPDSNPSPGGVMLPAGQVMALNISGAVYIYNPSAVSNTTFFAEFFA